MKNPGIFATACAAINCDFRPSSKKNIAYYSFPADDFWCKLWVLNCRRLDLFSLGAYTLHSSYKLCGLHFEEKMFKKRSYTLKLSAVPSIFDFPSVSFATPHPPSDPECMTKLPLGVVFEELTRVKVMSDGKMYITGGPLIRPGTLEIKDGKVSLKVNSNKPSVPEDMFYFVPVLIAIVEDGGISKIEHFHVLNYYLNGVKASDYVMGKRDFEITHQISTEEFLKGISIKLDIPLLDELTEESPSDMLCWSGTPENSPKEKSTVGVSVKPSHDRNWIRRDLRDEGVRKDKGEIQLESIASSKSSVQQFGIKKKVTCNRPRPNILRSKRKRFTSNAVTYHFPPSFPIQTIVTSENMKGPNFEKKEKNGHPVSINNFNDRLDRIEKILKKNDQVLDGGYLFAEPSSPESGVESPPNEFVNDFPPGDSNSGSENESVKSNEVIMKNIDAKSASAGVNNLKKNINFDEILPKDALPSDFSDLAPVSFLNSRGSEVLLSEAKDKISNSEAIEDFSASGSETENDFSDSGYPLIVNSSHSPLPDDLKKNLAKYLLINKDKDRVHAMYSGRKVRATRTFIKIPISGNSKLSVEKNNESEDLLKNPSFISLSKLSDTKTNANSEGENVLGRESHMGDNSVNFCEIEKDPLNQKFKDSKLFLPNDCDNLGCSDPLPAISKVLDPSSEKSVSSGSNVNISPNIKHSINLSNINDSIVNLKELILSNFPEGTQLISFPKSKVQSNIIPIQKDRINSMSVEENDIDSLIKINLSAIDENRSDTSGNDPIQIQNSNLSNKSVDVIKTVSVGMPNSKSETEENSVATVESPFVNNVVLPPHLIDIVNKITETQNPSKVILLSDNGNDVIKPNATPFKCYCQGIPPANFQWSRRTMPCEYIKLRDKYKSSVRKLKRLEKKVIDLKAKVKDPPKIKFTRVLEELRSNVSKDAYTLISAELKANSMGTKSRGFRFTEEMKELGARLLMAGPRVYKTFASVFTMPSKHTIKKWTNDRENRAIEALFAGKEFEPLEKEDDEQEDIEEGELQNNFHIEQVVIEEQDNEELSEVGSSMEDFSDVYQELIFEEVIENEN